MKSKKLIPLIIFTTFFLTSSKTLAMETIFNVPSAELTPKGHIFVQEEAQFRAWNPDAFYLGTTYTAIGIGNNTEIDATLFNIGAPATKNISLAIGLKSVMPIAGLKEKFPEREFKLTVGSNVLIGLEGNGVGNWTYAHLSGRVPKLNTRLTAGISYGTRQVFNQNTTSFIAGVEQPVTKKLGLIADWYSGTDHFLGYFITGISYSLPKKTTIYAGYQIPNSPENGTSGFIVQLAKIF